jgi:spermidine/putrescine transport system permease protein
MLRSAVEQTLRLAVYTTVIAVPIGVAFAIGIHRWHTRTSTSFNFVMVFSYVIPELIFGVAMFFLFTQLFTFVHLGTVAEVLGLVTWNFSWPAIIVLARLVSVGSSYEEAAADLGASRLQAIRRVLIPMLMPAIFASAVLVFASVVDDFVVVDLLSSTANTQPMSVIIYANTHGGNGGPALNALATMMLLFSFVVVIAGLVAYRWMTRGERGSSRHDAMTSIAGM